MSGYMDLYEESSDSDLDDFIDYISNIHRSIKNSKSPRQHEQVTANNENHSVIDGDISRDKITANNAKKQPILNESLRLRQNNVNCKDKENECITRFIIQVTHLSTENQSYSTPTTQESTITMRLMTLRLDNMLEQMENRCEEKLKLYVDKAFSDAIDKIKTINNEGVNTNMSAIENTAIQKPSKRKVPKKDNDNWNTRRTWSEKVGNVKKVLYLVGLDVRKVVIVNTRKFLVSINRAPDENLCQFLDIHMNIDTLAQDLFNP